MIISKADFSILKRMVMYYKPYIGKIVCVIVCIIISAGVSMFLPTISRIVTDDGLIAGNLKVIVIFSLVTLFVVVINELIGLIETRYLTYINSITTYNFSKHAFKHALRLKIDYFAKVNPNELMSNLEMDIRNMSRISDKGTFYIIESFFRMIGGLVGLILIDLKLTIIVICILPIRYFMVKFMAAIRRKLFEEYMMYNREYSSWYGDTIAGIREVKLWGIDRIKTGHFIKKQRNILNTNIKLAVTDQINTLMETILFQGIANLLYILGGYMILNKHLTIGGLFAFVTYSAYVTAPISAILNIGYSMASVIPSAKRFFEFLDTECENTSNTRITNLNISEIYESCIRFENVSFSYRNNEPVLENLSFEIKGKEKVAIIGTNGCGKSTIINLLLRFYKPKSGSITVDGVDINNVDLREYRESISVVSQDPYLFDTSVLENISLFRYYDINKLIKSAMLSTAHEFISNMKDGYKGLVGRNGTSISGGEKQKIAITRAIIRDSKILIMDEATSNCDIESESCINGLLNNELKDKTVIVISHRPDILKKVDRVIVLDKGKVLVSGTHDELYGTSVFYREVIDGAC